MLLLRSFSFAGGQFYKDVTPTALGKSGGVRQPSGALGVTVLGKDLRAAQAAAYAAVECIQFKGAHFRRDIAAKAF